jgi:hypothetical protein
LLQPAGALPDPSINDVSVTALSVNGDIFRGTVAAGAMRGRHLNGVYTQYFNCRHRRSLSRQHSG